MLPIKQSIESYSSKHIDGSLMYPGKYLCTYALLWNSVWVLINREAA